MAHQNSLMDKTDRSASVKQRMKNNRSKGGCSFEQIYT